MQSAGGAIKHSKAPLLIGAQLDAEAPVRQFRGELEEAAIWNRALTDQEIELR